MKRLNLTQGFTIIELTAVMVIIMIIAGLIVGVGSTARKRAMVTKAESIIAALEVAISMYRTDTGQYPTDDAGSGCANLYDELVNGTAFGGITPWRGPYMEFKSSELMGGVPEEIKDPWGNPYNYKTPGTNNTNSFDLWSNGSDEQSGTDDDVTNW